MLPIIIRITFGKLAGKGSKQHLPLRRRAIFAYLNACEPQELGLLFDLMLPPVGEGAKPAVLLGFLTYLEDALSQMGTRLEAHMNSLIRGFAFMSQILQFIGSTWH